MENTDQNEKEIMELKNFAYCGGTEGFFPKIKYLAAIAENERWSSGDSDIQVLIKYINGTFKQCYAQNKILYSDDGQYACFNTGLLTPKGNDIVALFEKNSLGGQQPWFLKTFRDKTEREFMNVFNTIPPLVTYTQSYEDLYYNPDYNIEINAEHILEDNWERIYNMVKLPKNVVRTLLIGTLEETKKRVRRNIRLVVPQFYNNEIMYLMPLRLPVDEEKEVIMALAVQKTGSNQYRANTIFTKDVAYEKARLLMRPESRWLVEE